MKEEERYDINSVSTVNQGGSFMHIRLNPQRVMKEIELFLSAKRRYIKQNDGGDYEEVEEKFGVPLANFQGVNSVLKLISMRINEQVVQGNFDREQYENYVYWTRKELTKAIVLNCYEWEIDDGKLGMVVDSIMGFLEPFMSRLIDNKERESYAQQFVSREVINQGQNKASKSGISNFAGGIN